MARRAALGLACWLLLPGTVWAEESPARAAARRTQNDVSDRSTQPAQYAKHIKPAKPAAIPLPLAPTQSPRAASGQRLTGGPSWVHMTSRLAIVLGLFGGLLIVQRWLGGQRLAAVPSDVIQVYGRVPLNARQYLLLVRVGERLLILLESPQGTSRLGEITDPAEVSRLVERFRHDATNAAPTLAREFLSQMGAGASSGRA